MEKGKNHLEQDDLNWGILESLQKNARLSIAEIGRSVGLSAPAVAQRIRKMEESGLITGYQTLLDLDKFDLTIRAFVLFKNHQLKHPELIQLVEHLPGIMEWHTITGNYAVILKIAVKTSQELAKIIEHLEEFGETNTSLILSKNARSPIVGKPNNGRL
jgi:Lrp/AsnC family leucine-responsive transcriptional regulator